ncbi:MAG TPA: SH3 domain-containing protein [Candidatus Wallbacteria bacterium]|nr:SH3 domain-containing protein [Candidatus Wallbacteria bacterium]
MDIINNLKRSRLSNVILLLIALSFLAVSTVPIFAGGIGDTLSSISQGQVSSTSGVPKGGLVTCSLLNVRSGPGTDYSIIGGVTRDCAVSIISEENGWWKINYNGGIGYVCGQYINTSTATVSETEKSENFTGTVNVNSSLNIRTAPWGDVIGSFSNGDRVEVVGKSGNWYKIKHNGGFAYVYADYINRGGAASTAANSENDNTATTQASGNTQQKIVKCAESYIGSTKFRGPEVDYGNLACAQFVSTALKDAGVVSQVRLGVSGVVADLKGRGWKEVSVPPFKAGDVITWKTYDADGDGVKDSDSHIGIIGDDGQAISNSSSLKMPRKHDIYYQPISRVLRLS